MGPREELITIGKPGPLFLDLLYKTVDAVVRGRTPPPGSKSWDRSARQELAHQFFLRKGAEKRLITLVTNSTDEDSFRRQLQKSVRNFLGDQGRKTDLGKVIVRLKRLLTKQAATGRFSDLGNGRWGLPGCLEEPATAAHSDLIHAMAPVKVVVPTWTSETRDAPLADEQSYARLVEAVLTEAEGSMTAEELATILIHRLDHIHTPLYIEDQHGEVPPTKQPAVTDPAAAIEADLTEKQATDFFEAMTDRDRRVFATRHLTCREAEETVGRKHAQVNNLRNALDQRLKDHLPVEEDPGPFALLVYQRCCEWLTDQTDPGGATLDTTLRPRKEVTL